MFDYGTKTLLQFRRWVISEALIAGDLKMRAKLFNQLGKAPGVERARPVDLRNLDC
jgi:hypothetical protein